MGFIWCNGVACAGEAGQDETAVEPDGGREEECAGGAGQSGAESLQAGAAEDESGRGPAEASNGIAREGGLCQGH